MRISDWSSDVCSSDLGPVRRVRRAGLLDARYSRSPHQGLVRRLPDRSRRARGRAPRSERCASSAPMTDESLAKLAKMLRFGNFRLGHETLLQEDVEALFERNSVGFRRSEEHTSELQSLMRTSYAVFCLKQKTQNRVI